MVGIVGRSVQKRPPLRNGRGKPAPGEVHNRPEPKASRSQRSARHRTGSGSDRILHSTCDLQFRWHKDPQSAVEWLDPVASEGPIWIVGVLDLSEAAYRFPHYKPSKTRPRPVAQPEADGCGNVVPLRLEDFRQLAPGERFDPTAARGGAAYIPLPGFVNFTSTDVGRYEIRPAALDRKGEARRVAWVC